MTKRLYRRVGSVGAVLAGIFIPGVAAMAEEAARTGGMAPFDQALAFKTIGLAVAASLAVGLSILGAGYAVGRIGSAALGLAAEKPELLTKSILFVALAEGLAVLGFAIAMMLMQKI
jgi:V/A-type H+/Na+-transporting ATPase subunit K